MVVQMLLSGRAERTIAAAFDDFDVSTTEHDTVIRGEVADHAALYGVIERVQRLGLKLVELQARDAG